MNHLLPKLFQEEPMFKTMPEGVKEENEAKYKLPDMITNLFRFHVYYQSE